MAPSREHRDVSTSVGVVLVNHNAGDHLKAAVDSLDAEGLKSVVVVDNASVDDSTAAAVSAHPHLRAFDRPNLGYGAGANHGVEQLDTEYVWCLNPDVTVHPGTIAALAKVLDADPSVAAVGPLMLNVDGSSYPSARRFPEVSNAVGHALLGLWWPANRWTRAYKRLDFDSSTSVEVDWISGASMLLRRSAFQSVKGFDPGYFMYMEDVDLCWRLRQAGWKIVFEPAAAVTHVGAVSTRAKPYRMLKEHHRSAIRYNFRTAKGAQRLLLPVLAAGLAVRLPVAWAHQYLTRRRQAH